VLGIGLALVVAARAEIGLAIPAVSTKVRAIVEISFFMVSFSSVRANFTRKAGNFIKTFKL